MSKLPVISGQQCVKALHKIGFELRSQEGSYIILVQTSTKKRISVLNHKTLAKGTLRAIIRQAELSIDEFVALL